MYLSSNLTYLRKKTKTSQAELADLLGVTNSAISGYEKGRNTPTFKNFLKLASFFNVNLNDFVYKNLSEQRAEASATMEPEATYTLATDKELLNLALHRIRFLESFIKTHLPSKANEAGV